MSDPCSRGIPPLFTRLVDDAALFPPARLPLPEALAAHRTHDRAWYSTLVGPFLCSDANLPDLCTALGDSPVPLPPDGAAGVWDLPVGLIITGGAGAIGPAVTWAARADRVQIAAVEVLVRDEPPLARGVARIALAVDHAGVADDVPVFVEIPRTGDWESALDAVAEAGYNAKLRTGGVVAEAFPSEREVAGFVLACLDREVPFKCTAGLHRAVRHTSADGFEQLGFLNLLLATRAGLDGCRAGDLADLLTERDTAAVVEQVRALDDAAAASCRRWCRSFGSCSVSEPLDDLVRLGFLQD